MNRRRITEKTKNISVNTNQPAGKVFLWSILAGAGLGIGFLIVNKIDKKLEKKSE